VVEDKVLDAVVFADIEVPGVAGRVTAGSAPYFTETSSADPLPIGSFFIPSSVTAALVSQ
jgi:hypothetical protein